MFTPPRAIVETHQQLPPPTEPLREIIFLHQFWGLGIDVVRDLFLHITDRRMRFSSEFMSKPEATQSLKNFLCNFLASVTVMSELCLKLPIKQGYDEHCEKLLRKIIEQYEIIVAVSKKRVDFARVADYETARSLIQKFTSKPAEWIVNQTLTVMSKYFTDIDILKKVLEKDPSKARGLLKKEKFDYIIENLTLIKDELTQRHKNEVLSESFINGVYILLERFDLLIKMLSW